MEENKPHFLAIPTGDHHILGIAPNFPKVLGVTLFGRSACKSTINKSRVGLGALLKNRFLWRYRDYAGIKGDKT